MDRSIHSENAAETLRLGDLVRRLTTQELRTPLGEGWTVAAALAHLAFWDRRACVLVDRWKGGGVAVSEADTDVINDSILPLCQAIELRQAGELAVRWAEAADRALKEITPELAAEIDRLGSIRLRRFEHRREHRQEIEKAIAVGPANARRGET